MGAITQPWWVEEADKSRGVKMMSEVRRADRFALHSHTDGVNRTALLPCFRLEDQIQLLQQMLRVFPTPENGWGCIWASTFMRCKCSLVDCERKTITDGKAICRDSISSFLNHMSWVLKLDRKFSHSLRVYYRSEHKDRCPDKGLGFHAGHVESSTFASVGVWSISRGFNEPSCLVHWW